MATATMASMSGAIASLLNSYRQVLLTYQRLVTGDPNALHAKASTLQQQATTCGDTMSSARSELTELGSNWSGAAQQACSSAGQDLLTRLGDSQQRLQAEAQRLSVCADALTKARSGVDQVISEFDQKANSLIAQSSSATADTAGSFVQAAKSLGDSAVAAAKDWADWAGTELSSQYGPATGQGAVTGTKNLGSTTVTGAAGYQLTDSTSDVNGGESVFKGLDASATGQLSRNGVTADGTTDVRLGIGTTAGATADTGDGRTSQFATTTFGVTGTSAGTLNLGNQQITAKGDGMFGLNVSSQNSTDGFGGSASSDSFALGGSGSGMLSMDGVDVHNSGMLGVTGSHDTAVGDNGSTIEGDHLTIGAGSQTTIGGQGMDGVQLTSGGFAGADLNHQHVTGADGSFTDSGDAFAGLRGNNGISVGNFSATNQASAGLDGAYNFSGNTDGSLNLNGHASLGIGDTANQSFPVGDSQVQTSQSAFFGAKDTFTSSLTPDGTLTAHNELAASPIYGGALDVNGSAQVTGADGSQFTVTGHGLVGDQLTADASIGPKGISGNMTAFTGPEGLGANANLTEQGQGWSANQSAWLGTKDVLSVQSNGQSSSLTNDTYTGPDGLGVGFSGGYHGPIDGQSANVSVDGFVGDHSHESASMDQSGNVSLDASNTTGVEVKPSVNLPVNVDGQQLNVQDNGSVLVGQQQSVHIGSASQNVTTFDGTKVSNDLSVGGDGWKVSNDTHVDVGTQTSETTKFGADGTAGTPTVQTTNSAQFSDSLNVQTPVGNASGHVNVNTGNPGTLSGSAGYNDQGHYVISGNVPLGSSSSMGGSIDVNVPGAETWVVSHSEAAADAVSNAANQAANTISHWWNGN